MRLDDAQHVADLAHLDGIEQAIEVKAGAAENQGHAGGGQALQAFQAGRAVRAELDPLAVKQNGLRMQPAFGQGQKVVGGELQTQRGVGLPQAVAGDENRSVLHDDDQRIFCQCNACARPARAGANSV